MNLKKIKDIGLRQKIYGISINLRNARQRKDSTKIPEFARKLVVYKNKITSSKE